MTAVVLAALLFFGSRSAAESSGDVKTIKDFRYEIRSVTFRGTEGINPFRPMVPLRTVGFSEDAGWKVRISGLKLTSVMVGRRKVAIFKEAHGPAYAYILVDGVLRGPDNKPIPGIEGKVVPMGERGEFHVTLRQGIHTIEFDHVIQHLRERSSRRARAAPTGGADATRGANKGGSR